MRSMLLLLALSFAFVAQGFHLTLKGSDPTSTKSRSSPSAVIKDKQISNAHFNRRSVAVNNETEGIVDHKARHTMVVNSPIRDSVFRFRSLSEQNASEPSVDRKARRTTIIDSDITNSRLHMPKMDESSLKMLRNRRDTFIMGGRGYGNRIFGLPARSYNEFIVDGDNIRATHYSGYRGNSVNVMRVGPSSSWAQYSQYRPATANMQAMPIYSNGGSQFGLSASAPSNGLPGVLQGVVINGAHFSRRSVEGQGEEKKPVEHKPRNTFIAENRVEQGVPLPRWQTSLA